MLATIVLLALSSSPADLAGYVRELAPAVGPRRAAQVAADAEYAGKMYGVDPALLVAISRQESAFRRNTLACHLLGKGRYKRLTCDYGIAQVNELWILKWDLDARRLRSDDRYNLCVAARILRSLKRRHGEAEPENWFGRYHSATPSIRARYEAKLAVFLREPPPPVQGSDLMAAR